MRKAVDMSRRLKVRICNVTVLVMAGVQFWIPLSSAGSPIQLVSGTDPALGPTITAGGDSSLPIMTLDKSSYSSVMTLTVDTSPLRVPRGNLVLGDTNRIPDVFVRDPLGGITTLVTIESKSTERHGHPVAPTTCRRLAIVAMKLAAVFPVEATNFGL